MLAVASTVCTGEKAWRSPMVMLPCPRLRCTATRPVHKRTQLLPNNYEIMSVNQKAHRLLFRLINQSTLRIMSWCFLSRHICQTLLLQECN